MSLPPADVENGPLVVMVDVFSKSIILGLALAVCCLPLELTAQTTERQVLIPRHFPVDELRSLPDQSFHEHLQLELIELVYDLNLEGKINLSQLRRDSEGDPFVFLMFLFYEALIAEFQNTSATAHPLLQGFLWRAEREWKIRDQEVLRKTAALLLALYASGRDSLKDYENLERSGYVDDDVAIAMRAKTGDGRTRTRKGQIFSGPISLENPGSPRLGLMFQSWFLILGPVRLNYDREISEALGSATSDFKRILTVVPAMLPSVDTGSSGIDSDKLRSLLSDKISPFLTDQQKLHLDLLWKVFLKGGAASPSMMIELGQRHRFSENDVVVSPHDLKGLLRSFYPLAIKAFLEVLANERPEGLEVHQEAALRAYRERAAEFVTARLEEHLVPDGRLKLSEVAAAELNSQLTDAIVNFRLPLQNTDFERNELDRDEQAWAVDVLRRFYKGLSQQRLLEISRPLKQLKTRIRVLSVELQLANGSCAGSVARTQSEL